MADSSNEPQANKPVTPPPAYADSESTFAIPQPGGTAGGAAGPMPSHHNTSEQGYFAPLASPPMMSNQLALPHYQQSHYGPTPISTSQQQGLLSIPLPYYDPHSPYAIAQASSRARWRFFAGLLFALGVLAVISALLGDGIEATRRLVRH